MFFSQCLMQKNTRRINYITMFIRKCHKETNQQNLKIIVKSLISLYTTNQSVIGNKQEHIDKNIQMDNDGFTNDGLTRSSKWYKKKPIIMYLNTNCMFCCKFVHLYSKQGQSYINAKTHLRMSTHTFEPNKKKFFRHKQKN